MRVSEVKFTKRYNVGNYEHEEYSLNAVLEEDENHVEAMSQLKADVIAAYTEEKSTVKKSTKKAAAAVVEEEEEETTETETSDEEDTAEEVEEEPVLAAKKGKAKKTFKKKAQVYQRSNDTHKELFSGVMNAVAPAWKKTTESKAKAKEVSMKFEGVDFLDENGSVLETFKAAVKKAMSKK